MISRLLSSGRTPAKYPRHSLRVKRFSPQRQRVGQGRGAWLLQPAFRVVKDHLAAIILNEVADQFAVQVDIQGFRHALFLAPSGDRRRRQRDPDSQRLQDRQNLTNLAGFLALFEVDDKAQTRAGGQRQVLLRDAQPLPAFPDRSGQFPVRCISLAHHSYSRTGIIIHFQSKVKRKLPYGNNSS